MEQDQRQGEQFVNCYHYPGETANCRKAAGEMQRRDWVHDQSIWKRLFRIEMVGLEERVSGHWIGSLGRRKSRCLGFRS